MIDSNNTMTSEVINAGITRCEERAAKAPEPQRTINAEMAAFGRRFLDAIGDNDVPMSHYSNMAGNQIFAAITGSEPEGDDWKRARNIWSRGLDVLRNA